MFRLTRSKLLAFLSTGAFVFFAAVFSIFAQPNEIEINIRPVRDFSDKFKPEIAANRIELTAPFFVELKGSLNVNGRLDSTSSAFTRTEGDVALTKVVKEAILAISDAGYLQYLSILSATDIKIVVEQNSSQFAANIVSSVESSARAKTITSALNMMIVIAKTKNQAPEATEAAKKDLFLLNGLEVRSDDTNIHIALKLPSERLRALVLELVSK